MDETKESQASALCIACGLCCDGHLFAWVKLKHSELDPAEKLGLEVFRSDPNERGFNQPCPLWKGKCSIYESPHYPRFCRAYQCKLLKELLYDDTNYPDALNVVRQARAMIADIEPLLPPSNNKNFRERLVAYIEHPDASAAQIPAYHEFRAKADALLRFYADHFGVTDFLE